MDGIFYVRIVDNPIDSASYIYMYHLNVVIDILDLESL